MKLETIWTVALIAALGALAAACDSDTLGQACTGDTDCNAGQMCSTLTMTCERVVDLDSGPNDFDAGPRDAAIVFESGPGPDAGPRDAGPPPDGDPPDTGAGADGGGPRCGDGVRDVVLGEQCDDGNVDPNDGCSSTCRFEPVGATCGDSTIDPLEKCDPPEVMPADGDGCNATCNLSGQVSTLGAVPASAITSDNTHLFVGVHDCAADVCGVGQIDIAACNAAPNTAACQPTFLSGGPGQCACASGNCGGGGVTPAPAVIDGDAATATFADFGSLTTDGATIWIGQQQTLRAIDVATGAVTTVAGTNGSCAAIDGNGASALFYGMRALTFTGGLVYLLDGTEGVLRSFDPSTGDVLTVAGTRRPDCQVTQSPPYTCRAPCNFAGCGGGPTSPSAGVGPAAVLVSPRYLASDEAGRLYVIDTNGEAILRFDTTTAQVDVLISGSAALPAAYVDGDAASTTLGRPRGIVSDGTSVYFGEQAYATIRQVELGPLTTTTFVGTHGCIAGGTTAPRDGLGAYTTGAPLTAGPANNRRCAANPPAGTPIFNPIFGAMTYHFPTRSIYAIDGDQLRRIE